LLFQYGNGAALALNNDDASGERRTFARWPIERDRVLLAVAGVVLVGAFGIAYAVDRRFVEAGVFALAAVAAFAALAVLLTVRARGRRQEEIVRELHALAERQRVALAEATGDKPEPRVLFLQDNAGVHRMRVERRRPRPIDVDQTVAHERTLSLRTLPSARTPLVGSLKLYREPTEHDRNRFREKVEKYATSLREALVELDTYRLEQGQRISGRFRVENQSRRAANRLTVRAYFPDPFEVVRESTSPEPPAIPRRPTFHGKRAGLTALLGGETRAPGSPVAAHRSHASSRGSGNVSRPVYREGSAIVEVGVESLTHSAPADMGEDDRWVLRLERPGVYPIRWEICGDDLSEPVRGELWLEVVERLDDTPIQSVKELFAEVAELDRDPISDST
jgi:hypothetical protein